MPTSVPEVLEEGMLSKVFYRGRMTSQMQVTRKNICLGGGVWEMLIIATLNYSDIPFSGIIKFTDAKTSP